MRCDLITPANRLQKSMKRLQESWLRANTQWDDAVSRRFQEEHLEPIVPKLQLTLAAIHQLMEVLDDAVKETRDEAR